MKIKKTFFILTCLLAVSIPNSAKAAEQPAKPMGTARMIIESNDFNKDWGYAIGLKAWMSEWSCPFRYTGNFGLYVDQAKSDSETVFFPSAMVRYRNFFIGGSYLPETSFEFSEARYSYWMNSIYGWADIVLAETSAERKEWDVNLGYFIFPNLALSVGFKKIEREYNQQFTMPEYNETFGNCVDEKFNIPIVGLSASLPFNEKFHLYGNFAYGWIDGDAVGTYSFGELGLSYIVPFQKIISAITVNAGYRFQILEYNSSEDSDNSIIEDDVTDGFIFSTVILF